MQFNNITPYVNIDEQSHIYTVSFAKNNIPNLIDSNLSQYLDNQSQIMLPSVSDLLNIDAPYFSGYVPQKNVDIAIARGILVHQLVDQAIKQKNGPKIVLPINPLIDKFIIQLTKRIITELNSFIYTYKVTQIYSEQSYVYLFEKGSYVGTTDVLLKTANNEWILIDIKTSRTSHIDRYTKQLNLYRHMIMKSNPEVKITKMYIINPRTENTVIAINTLDTKTINTLIAHSNKFVFNK